jgi:signal transduction histidine kinase
MTSAPRVPPPIYEPPVRDLRLRYLALSETDCALLNELAELLEPQFDPIVEAFYAHLTQFEATRDIFADDAMVARLKIAQKGYLRQALRGPYDEAYFQRRWRIGYIHNVIGLEPEWFIGAYTLYRSIVYPRISAHYGDDPDALTARLLAFDKVMTLDMGLALESYWAHYTAGMQELRELNRRLRAAIGAKAQFVANISHELRTPLNAIVGFAELLEEGAAGPVTAAQAELLGDIHDAGRLLLRVINGLLDFSHIETGRIELFYEQFAPAQVIRETLMAARASLQGRPVTLEVDVATDLGFIEADRYRFKQMLGNLLSNAVKFTATGRIAVSACRRGEVLHVTVSDTGIGIAPEDHDRIFDGFARADDSHATSYAGVGLGLALTRHIALAHCGRVWVESRLNEGSTFHLALPVHRSPQPCS